MAGTINLALTQQLDEFGKPLSGGALYFFRAGTVADPQDSFQDTQLTTKMPYPIPLDAAGRIPQFFLADGLVKVRLQDRAGVVKFVADNLLVIGPSAGGGSGGTSVDPTTIAQVGDLKARYDVAVLAGWVRCNARTIGNATSGASERQNADCQNLFQFLWNVDPNLSVWSGGSIVARGANAAADWNASRQISLPDWRGRAISGLDGMGSGALAGKLTSTYFGAAADTLGADGGQESRALTAAQCSLPQHAHNVYVRDTGHGHLFGNVAYRQAGGADINFYTVSGPDGYTTLNTSPYTVNTGNAAIAVSSVNGGSADNSTTTTPAAAPGAAHAAIGPRRLCTIFIKL